MKVLIDSSYFVSLFWPKDVSVIDCTSIILLKKYNLDAILTFDRHFSRVAGSRSAGRSLGVRVIPKG